MLLQLFKQNKQAVQNELDQAIADQDLVLSKLNKYQLFAAEHLDQLYHNLKDPTVFSYPLDFITLTNNIVDHNIYKIATGNEIFKQIKHTRSICSNPAISINLKYDTIDQFRSLLCDHLNDLASDHLTGLYYKQYCYIERTKRYKNTY